MLGYASKAEAHDAYMANYSKGWREPLSVVAMPLPSFKKWVLSGKTAEGELKPKTQKEWATAH